MCKKLTSVNLMVHLLCFDRVQYNNGLSFVPSLNVLVRVAKEQLGFFDAKIIMHKAV